MAELRIDISEVVNRAVDDLIKLGWRPSEWIPVEDALPDSEEDVLVLFEYFRYGEYNCLYQTYGIGNYFSYHDNWLIDKSTRWRDLRVIAWTQLPEPPEKE